MCEFQKSPLKAGEVGKFLAAISEIRTPDPGPPNWDCGITAENVRTTTKTASDIGNTMYPQATIAEFNSLTEGSTITVAVTTFVSDKATIMLLNKEQRDNFLALVDSEDPNDDGALGLVTEMIHLSPGNHRCTFTVPATGSWYVLSDNRECVCQVSYSENTP